MIADCKTYVKTKNTLYSGKIITTPHPAASSRAPKTIKYICNRPGVPLSLDDAGRIVRKYIENCSAERLHSAIGYAPPADELNARDQEMFKEPDRKPEEA